MKRPLLYLLTAALLAAHPAAEAATAHSKNSKNPDPSVSLFQRTSERLKAVSLGISFYYITQEDRIRILTDLFQSIKNDYAPLEIKKKLFQLDLEEMKRSALNAESAIPDTTNALEQADSNLKFIDRTRKIVAQFRDTHFAVNTRTPMNQALVPFSLEKVAGKYIIVNRYTKLMAFLAGKATAFGTIELGDEVLSFDGVPVEKAKDELMPYISGSSDLWREKMAVEALTARNFALPNRGFTVIEIRHANGRPRRMKFPLLYRAPDRGDQALFMSSMGYTRYDDLRLGWDEERKQWKTLGIEGDNEDYENSLPALSGGRSFTKSGGSVAVRTGYLIKGGKAYGLLQINTFKESKILDEKQSSVGFKDILRSFIKELEANAVPLILDLRANGGGNSNYPRQLLSMLTEKDKKYGSQTEAYPTTRNIQQILDEATSHETAAEELEGLSEEQLQTLMQEALRSKEVYTSAFSNGDVNPDPEVGGYSQKIVALISPNCISACDIMASLLKSSGRATLIGLPSNGTGAGFLSTANNDSSWTDSFRVFKSEIPNFLFGSAGPVGTAIFPGQAETLNLENRPTVPDVAYAPALDDILGNSSGWIKKALETLAK